MSTKMKRFIVLALALLMLASLSACHKESADAEASNNSEDTSITDSSVQEEVSTEDTSVEEEINFCVVTPDNVGAVIVDADEYSFTVTRMDTAMKSDGAVKYPLTIGVMAENKSADKEYTFSVSYVSVNNLPVSQKMGQSYNGTVAAGQKVENTITYSYAGFPDEICDYSAETTCASFWLAVEDADGNEYYHKIVLYPNGESNAEPYARGDVSTDRLFYDDNGVKLTYAGAVIDDDRECYVYVENSTRSNLSISVKKVKINGVECTGSGSSIFAYEQTVNYGFTYFSQNDFDNAGVKEPSDIKTIEFTFDLVFNDLGNPFGRRVNDITVTVNV